MQKNITASRELNTCIINFLMLPVIMSQLHMDLHLCGQFQVRKGHASSYV